MKCRGCGLDTRDYKSEIGWMHYKCEIERLRGLLAELDSEAKEADQHFKDRMEMYMANIQRLEAENAGCGRS